MTKDTILNFKIRKAEQKDCSAILGLVKELAIYEKAPNEVILSVEDFVSSGFAENPVWWAFVAECENEIVGFALYYTRFSTWKGCRMYLEDLYVKESFRKYGIGTMLFDTLINEAHQRKFNAICWQVLDWNEPAINFYKKYQTNFSSEWINGTLEIHQ